MSQADPAEHQERSLGQVCEALALCITKRKCRFLTRAASSRLFHPTRRTTLNYKVGTRFHKIVELLILKLWRAAFQPVCPQCALGNGVVPPQGQDFALSLVQLHGVPVLSSLERAQILLAVSCVVPSTLKTAVLKVSLNFFGLLGSL